MDGREAVRVERGAMGEDCVAAAAVRNAVPFPEGTVMTSISEDY